MTFTGKEVKEAMIEFAKLHVEEALKVQYNNIGFIKITSEKLNSEEYKPFLTDENGEIWTINKDSILNAYPLDNIK